MSDLVNRAIRFAKETHQRIDHRRKYSNQPYSDHLEQVAKIVISVTDDEEMIAAAWLHDVVEDTPATLDNIEHGFGASVAQLVRDLTDISKPNDGNRAVRKAIDREHLMRASGAPKQAAWERQGHCGKPFSSLPCRRWPNSFGRLPVG